MGVVLICFFLLALHGHTSAQTGEFPSPATIALHKPVVATSTCGEEAETFCRYSSNVDASLSPNCLSTTCDNTCLHSSSSPSSTNLVTLGTPGEGVTTSLVAGPGETSVTQFSNSFISIPSSSVPQISSNGFTFAAWMKQDDNNNGALLSKASSDGLDRTYAVLVTETSVMFDYLPSTAESGFTEIVFSDLDLSSNFWHHIAVTVFENDFALYVNGTIEQAMGLTASIDDTSTDTVHLGQIESSMDQYNGLMQDVYYYSQALTAREIKELATGEFPYDYLQSECRCPPSHPVINSVSSGLCIQHTGTVTNRGSETRLNSLSHTIGYVNDNNYLTTWISGIDIQQSNITITFVSGSNLAFELIFIFIRYGSPAPKAAIVEKSIDGGVTYTPMQYFSDDCNSYFGLENDAPLQSNDDVNCITDYSSQSPTTGVTARVRLNDGSRGELDDSNEVLLNFALADHIRLQLIDYYTMNTTSQHRYYGISDITVAARCACNGHAPSCSGDLAIVCNCMHNTQGDRCDECLPLYNDKPWRKGTSDLAYPCKICNCNNHATACHYNETLDASPSSYELGGGGVCDSCQDNTAGRNCETCVFGYFRKAGIEASDSQPCSPCDCNSDGSSGEDCNKQEQGGEIIGQCNCKANVEGLTCDECKDGFFNLMSNNSEGCEPCNCNTDGTFEGIDTCNAVTGQCVCKLNVMGLKCDQCINGTQGLSNSDPNGCSLCNCDVVGAMNVLCDSDSGKCTCKPGVTGLNCDQCLSEYYGLSENGCQECECSAFGSVTHICEADSGICSCSAGFTGQNCDQCLTGFFNLSQICTPCQCDTNGTISSEINSCDMITGQCICKENVIGRDCDTCAPNYTNLQQTGCNECDCTLINTDTSDNVLCDPVTSQCICLPSAGGLKCDSCLAGYYPDENQSCEECNCNSNGGAIGIDCAPLTGQCFCSSETITGQACDQCAIGHYDFPNCFACQCHIAGSINTVCDSVTGECQCKEFVTGMNCDTCQQGYDTLEASNPFGCSTDPEEQSPPLPSLILSRSILITWSPPEKPNGVIALYGIIRNNTLIDSIPGSILSYNDTSLIPNTFYMYQVESENIAGSTISEGIVIMTLEGAPEEVNPPSLTVINSTSLRADWISPNITNGVIINYNLLLVSVDNVQLESSVIKFNGLALSYIVTGLTPFTVNTFVLEACTKEKCGISIETSGTTAEAVPEFQSSPSLTVISSTTVAVNWVEPTQPNGVIVKYEVYIRSSPFSGDGMSTGNVSEDTLSFSVNNLQPFVEYEFSVASFTSAGGKRSEWTRETTEEAVPQNLFDLIVIPVSSSELQVQWSEPANPNGIILSYQIFIQHPNNSQGDVTTSSSIGSYIVSGLSPFTSYGFFVIVCNTAGCASSNNISNVTLESAPAGLQPPIFAAIYSESIELLWNSPENPNGIITRYSISRLRPSLQSSPAKRNIGTLFHGVDFASYPANNNLEGVTITISVMFKTLRPDGVLIYSINTGRTDMIAIELRNGKPWFIFDAGSGPAAITLDENTKYNDGKWHELVATKSGLIGDLTVDGNATNSGMSIGDNNFIGTPSVLFIGGLNNEAALTTITGNLNENATLNDHSFAGCLFGIKFNGNNLNLSTILNPNPGIGPSNKGCPIEQEYGISFLGGGYLSMPHLPPTTEPFSFSIWFRTTRSSGLIFFAYGSDSHIVVKLQDSDLIVKVKGVNSSEITLSSAQVSLQSSLCNGQWYKLAVSKEVDGLLVTIDDQSISTSIQNSLNINTTSNFYTGGVPVSSEVWNAYYNLFLTYPVGFSGCMRNLIMDNTSINLHQDFGDSLEHVRFDGCDSSPVAEGSQTCNQDVTSFDNNLETSFIDSGLTPFTEYLYQVTASNSAGQTFSSWSLDMSAEDSPEEVGVVTVASITSSSLAVNWLQQQTANGIIIHYEIIATPISTVGIDSPIGAIQSSLLYIQSPIQELITEIVGLEPASNYSIVIQAYTGAGFGTGPPIYASTLEDIPGDVQIPVVVSQSSTEVTLQWDPPIQPNGVIILYRLYIADTFIETTGSMVTVQSLEPFTKYVYVLEACTAVGCTNSSVGFVSTIEGVPAGLDPPSLIGLSSTIVQASWTMPSQPNGIITYYELFRVFGDDLSQTELVANTTSLIASVSGLLPSTLYSFRLIAYNSFGSVTSNVSTITTLEDTPEQILPPVITVINSSSLLVSWQEPLQPNGVITNYTIFRNSASVFIGYMNYSFLDTDLLPFTTYSYFILACTAKGCGASQTNSGMTDEAIPESIQQPDIISVTAYSVMVNINAVGKPNGIVRYVLRVTGEFLLGYDVIRETIIESRLVYNETDPSQFSITELVPFSSYSILLEVTNSAGSVSGDLVPFTTLTAAPEGLFPPQLSLVVSTVLNITWSPPIYPNGNVTSFIITLNTTVSNMLQTQTHSYTSDTTNAIVYDLIPFSEYIVTVTAVNVVGNTTSNESIIMTSEIAPTDFDKPTLTSTASYSIAVSWDPPSTPNGVILNYTITTLQSDNDDIINIFTVSVSTSQYNITGLIPFTEYNITIETCNSVGCEDSPSITATTNEAAPELIATPTFTTSPNAVTIFWEEPAEKNGIILLYTIYRAIFGGTFSVLDTIAVDNGELQYTDNNIKPFMTYQYYIEASNSAGFNRGNSSSILTQQAAPEDVLEPLLLALSSSTVLVTIIPPLQPNGLIIQYTIGRYSTPSNTIYTDISVLNDTYQNISYTDTKLNPFTVYVYFITAFTIAGNTTGNISTVQTLEAPPTDLAPPDIILNGDVSILIGWDAPLQENGVITSYKLVRGSFGYSVDENTTELYKTMLASCCESNLDNSDSSGILSNDNCVLIIETDGDTTSYIDDNLDYYIYYGYCIGTYNEAGGIVSSSSDLLQTSPAPQPLAGPNITAITINSSTIIINWTIPDVSVLLGPLTSFILYGKKAEDTGLGLVLVTGLDQEYIANGLTPSTKYTFVVEVSNSQGTAFGMSINATTLDGIPIGVQNPSVQATSATSILITWVEPLTPNGDIIRYSIFINSELYYNQSTPGNLTVTGLKPFTTYVVQLEACTVLGCAKSGLSSNKTFEAAPTGLASPTVSIQSPYTAIVVWSTPQQLNGIITQYNLYIRQLVACLNDFCFERNLIFSGLAFNFTATELDPATEYGFEVIALNGGGNVSSGFTTETTHEAPPTLVFPPEVVTISAYSIRIDWDEPEEPNGVISIYILYRDGVSIGGIMNTLTYMDTSLSPFTEYSYILEACTSAGCTNSTEAVNTTFEAQPEDFIDPIFTNVESNSLVISWFEPLSPNGIIINYSVFFANGTIIFDGFSNLTSVNGLSPFTNYSFIVTVCNSADCLDSNTVTVTTLEAPPSNMSAPTIKDLSSMSVEVSWLSPLQPNGLITTYRLRRDGIIIFDGLAFEYDDESLEGDTQYIYSIEAVNSVGSIISSQIVIHTQADIPSNIATPTTTVLNSTAISVDWTVPDSSNGVITAYKLFVNDVEVLSGFQFSYVVSELIPFTQYTFYVQVCNQVGCTSSKSAVNTTEEDVPVNLAAPILTSISATAVLVSWSKPVMPNGAIITYRVLRRETDNPLLILIQYVGGPVITSFTNQDLNPYTSYEYQVSVFNSKGSTASPWSQVTTLEAPPTNIDPPIFLNVQSTYVTVSWEEPANPNGILIQYEVLYRPLLGQLILYETVPFNVTQVNVTDLTPFTLYEFKIVVSNSAGELESDFGNVQTSEAAPEGLGNLILVTKTNESLTLTWNEPETPNGMISEYALYLDSVEEYRDSLNIAIIDRLKPFTGYSLQLEACTSAACTTGQIFGFTTSESSPVGQFPPTVELIDSRSVMITWDFPSQPNGIIISYDIFRMEVLEPLVDNSTGDSLLVYTTLDVSNRVYNDTTLTPDTGYLYAVRVNNSVGYFLSSSTYIQTPQAPPESVQIPVLEVMGTSSIGITWDPPGQENGELIHYRIYRITMNNNVITVYSGLNREYIDNGLKPYTLYQYIIEACTIAGCTNGSLASATTDQSIPESINPPVLTAISSSSVSATWSVPVVPNGEIVSYKLNVITPISINMTVASDILTTMIQSLEPYTQYTVIVQACTVIGCVSSDSNTVTTLESVPMLQGSPSVIALGPSSVDVFWTEPDKPNGIIINYILRRNDTIVYQGIELSFIDNDLIPNQNYVYDVQSFTMIGGGERSVLSLVTTHSDTPTGIDPPILLPLDSTSILVTWAVPNVTNGDIQKYILYVNGTVMYEDVGLGYVVSNLNIFTIYQFRVEACTSTCGSSLFSFATTKEDIPNDISPPTLTLSTNQTVLVTWLPPSTPNGIILTFTVERTQIINELFDTVIIIAESIPATIKELIDNSSSLAPATTYYYRVTASNSVGSTTSSYSSIILPDGVPQNVSAPVLISKTATTLTVSVSPPDVPNGVLTKYTLFGDNLFPIVEIPSSQTEPVIFTHSNLDPFTDYRVYAEVCTVGGCVLGLANTFITDEDIPQGLLSPFVTTESPRRIRIEWSSPSSPNGIITGYQLFYKLPCPQPLTTTTTTVQCTVIDYQLLVNTTSMIYSFDSTVNLLDPYPYTSYQFKLQAENVAGTANSTETDVITTAESVPEQISPLLFTVYTDNTSIALNWGSTFRLNGQLKSYTVIRDGIFLLIGTQTYAVFANQPINTILQFSVRASNSDFQVTTASIPLEIDVVEVQPSSVTVTETPTVTTISSDTQFYEEAPFIVGMIVLAIILCFVLLVIALCLIRPNRTQSSGKYDTLRSEKGSPLREDGTVASGWSHERMTPVPSYHDALRNYPLTTDNRRTASSYSPVKSEIWSRDNSYSPDSKAELAAIYLQDEIPLMDTRISRLSVHEDIPMKQFTPEQKQRRHYELQRIDESNSEQQNSTVEQSDEEMDEIKLRKNIPITSSQESMLDTKI